LREKKGQSQICPFGCCAFLYLSTTAPQRIPLTLQVAFLFFSFIIKYRCENYGSSEDPVYFMTQDTKIQCWTKQHFKLGFIIGGPILILGFFNSTSFRLIFSFASANRISLLWRLPRQGKIY